MNLTFFEKQVIQDKLKKSISDDNVNGYYLTINNGKLIITACQTNPVEELRQTKLNQLLNNQ